MKLRSFGTHGNATARRHIVEGGGGAGRTVFGSGGRFLEAS